MVDLWDLVLRVLKIRREDNDFHHSPFKALFYYPERGVGAIYERMADEVVRYGGTLSLNTRVEAGQAGSDRIQSRGRRAQRHARKRSRRTTSSRPSRSLR